MEPGTASWHMDDVLQPHSFDDFETFLNNSEGDPDFFFDDPIGQQTTQDFDLLFMTDNEFQPWATNVAEWPQTVTALPELATMSPYPTELNLQQDLDGELGLNPSYIKPSCDQTDWLDSSVNLGFSQADPEHLVPSNHEAGPKSLRLTAEVLKIPERTHMPAPITSSGGHMSAGSRDEDALPKSPLREEVIRAIETLKSYFDSDANRQLLQPREFDILEQSNDILRSLVDRKQVFPDDPEHYHGSKVERTTISISQKKALEFIFSISPYLTALSLENCSAQIGLPVKTIRTWFSNARARKLGTQQPRPISPPIGLADPDSVSTANIKAVDRSSPDPSTASITRYLGTSLNEEPHAPLWSGQPRRPSPPLLDYYSSYFHSFRETQPRDCPSPPRIATTPHRSDSIAGSDASMSSVGSMMSHTSFKSIDHRGARRGRRRWIESPADLDKSMDQTTHSFQDQTRDMMQSLQNAVWKSEQPRKGTTIFCTWPNCDKTFKNRSEWTRHEEAMHYCPSHWVCCLETASLTLRKCCYCESRNVPFEHVAKHLDFESCMNKEPALRTFLRKDHLIQHITATHMKHLGKDKTTPFLLRELAAAWKTDNPAVAAEALYCGFCGISLSNWETRQDHVFGHIRGDLRNDPACKSSWQSYRDFRVDNELSSTGIAENRNTWETPLSGRELEC